MSRFSVEVSHVVISVGVEAAAEEQGCPQNVELFLRRMLLHPINTALPELTIIAPSLPEAGPLGGAD